MKSISFDRVRSLNIPPEKCYKWAEEMIYNKENAFLPAKINMTMPGDIFCNVMPSFIPGTEGTHTIGGIKVVTRYPERKPTLDSKILLFNADTGEFLSLIDGNWITAMRTGAVATHSIINLAKSDWSTVGMIGLGNVARATLLVLATVSSRPIEIKLYRYKDQAELFEERFREFSNLRFVIVDSIEECIKGSDIVISCVTYFANDVARDDWFDEGVLVIPVHTRGFTNCDLFFDKVFADDTSHVDHFKNFSKFRYFAEMSDVVRGRSPGRETQEERILAYNIGVSTHDVNFAANIYRMIKKMPEIYTSLPDIDMHDPDEKFWV